MPIIRSVYRICVLLSWLIMAGASPAHAAEKSWTNNEAMLSYFEVLQLIESHSLAQTPLSENVKSSIEHVLGNIDPYSRYLSPEDYQIYLDTLESAYSGIGADLTVEPDGKVILHPRPGSPADEAGVETGDQLFAVDKQSIENLSLIEVTSKIRGTDGTKVRIFVKKTDGRIRTYEIKRAPTRSVTLEKALWEGFETLRLYEFTPQTHRELTAALEEFDPSSNLILDLRGNSGGDLFAAIQCAKLFLPSGAVVVRISKANTKEIQRSTTDGPFQERKLFLLQDSQTASAAEVFIDALIQNKNASNWGAKSYGKAVTQQVFPMSNGGALFLTDGILERQDDSNWNGKGLEPEGELQDLLNRLLSPQPTFKRNPN